MFWAGKLISGYRKRQKSGEHWMSGCNVGCVDSGSSQSPRPIQHEQAAQFPVSNLPESHEQNKRPATMRT